MVESNPRRRMQRARRQLNAPKKMAGDLVKEERKRIRSGRDATQSNRESIETGVADEFAASIDRPSAKKARRTPSARMKKSKSQKKRKANVNKSTQSTRSLRKEGRRSTTPKKAQARRAKKTSRPRARSRGAAK